MGMRIDHGDVSNVVGNLARHLSSVSPRRPGSPGTGSARSGMSDFTAAAWIAQYRRRRTIRDERRGERHHAFLTLECAVIGFNHLPLAGGF